MEALDPAYLVLATATSAIVFYLVGGALAVLALVLAFTGMRSDEFPSQRTLRVIVPLFALVVVGAATTAVVAAREEQRERNEELAHEQGEGGAGGEEEDTDETPADDPEQSVGSAGDQPGDASSAGAEVFLAAGCAGCHTLAAAESDGNVGPNLDTALRGRDRDYVRTAIVDPNADISEGFPPDLMPGTYADTLTEDQIDQLVALLAKGG